MAVEQKKAAFDKANDKSESRVDSKVEETEGEILSEDELDAVAGGVYISTNSIFDSPKDKPPIKDTPSILCAI